MSPTFDAQAAFTQVTQRLDALQESQQQTQQILLQTVEIQTGMLASLRQAQLTQAEMLADIRQLQTTQAELQADTRQLRNSQAEMQATQTEMQATQAEMQATQAEMQTTQAEMKAAQAEMRADIKQLRDSHLTLLRVQNNMLDYMKFTFDQQAKWNERQDQFNIIFLDELRAMRQDVRQREDDAQSVQNKMYQEIKDRIVRLEDFMNDQLRKAS